MYLKSLTLRGFKSFADTTTLHLEPGITVVVGPNGSGKSNVVDAVAWVLGAQGPRVLRSAKMDDVIFAGSASRPALGRAEVSLTIDNASGMLPIDVAEVTISRTLFRTGASEYAVNQVPCRLLDIQELLSDSGVGRTQHVIVGQGQIDAVLEARPEERRAVIEEAAGILKFRRRKEKAERRLASTEANLVRLTDLAREARRQLRPLERQAEAARRHGELVAELGAIRLHLAGRELVTLAARRAANEDSRASLGAEEAEARAGQRAVDAELDAAQRSLVTAGTDGSAEVWGRAERLREQARGLTAVLAERRRGAVRDRAAAMDETVVASLEEEAWRLRRELEAAEGASALLAPDVERLAGAEAALAEEVDALEASDGAAVAGGAPSPVDRAREARTELALVRSAVERGDAECARTRLRATALAERKQRVTAERDELVGRLVGARRELIRAQAGHGAAAAEVARAEVARSEAEVQLRAADGQRHSWTARADALAAALDEARARAGVERLADVAEVVATLPELVDVDPGWEAAFEAAAGAALGAVVVGGDHEVVRRCLARLRDDGAGVVLGVGTEPSVREPWASEPASTELSSHDVATGEATSEAATAGERVRSHVHPRRCEVAPLLDRLLGPAVCVGGTGPHAWHDALDVVVSHPGAVVVTLAGDRFAPDGWRVGDQAAGPTSGVLEEARRRVASATTEAEQAEADMERARAALDCARAAEAGAARRAQDEQATVVGTDAAVARVTREVETVAAEIDDVGRQLASLQEAVARDRRRVHELEEVLPALESAEADATARRRELEVARRRCDERAAALRALRSDVEVRASALVDRRCWLRQRLDEVDRRLAGNLAARAQAEARRVELDRRLVAIDRLSALVDERGGRLEEILVAGRERRRLEVERARARSQHLEGLRGRRVELEQHLEALRARRTRAEMEAQELSLRTDAALETLRRDFDVEPEAAALAGCPPLPEGVGALARSRELEREARLLGPINPLALEEAVALRERQEFLDSQLDDVKASRRELAKVIRTVDAEIVDVFVAAFADVAENFSRLFSLLFPGGQGSLELTDPANPLGTGIRVRARPAGKNVRSISLLSGGERSLTALAYLFAVFRSRPSPFYVLDEVEAALDDVNLHRFLDLVGEFRREAQLLIVSHQQRTMETADVLYGVTMAPGGTSGVVSERAAAAIG